MHFFGRCDVYSSVTYTPESTVYIIALWQLHIIKVVKSLSDRWVQITMRATLFCDGPSPAWAPLALHYFSLDRLWCCWHGGSWRQVQLLCNEADVFSCQIQKRYTQLHVLLQCSLHHTAGCSSLGFQLYCETECKIHFTVFSLLKTEWWKQLCIKVVQEGAIKNKDKYL